MLQQQYVKDTVINNIRELAQEEAMAEGEAALTIVLEYMWEAASALPALAGVNPHAFMLIGGATILMMGIAYLTDRIRSGNDIIDSRRPHIYDRISDEDLNIINEHNERLDVIIREVAPAIGNLAGQILDLRNTMEDIMEDPNHIDLLDYGQGDDYLYLSQAIYNIVYEINRLRINTLRDNEVADIIITNPFSSQFLNNYDNLLLQSPLFFEIAKQFAEYYGHFM